MIATEPLESARHRRGHRGIAPAPGGSRGLDVGCGVGLQAAWLAEAVGPSGHVTGLDMSPRLLEHARRLAEQSDWRTAVPFREGDMSRLPFADNTFDWLWSADCAGYVRAA